MACLKTCIYRVCLIEEGGLIKKIIQLRTFMYAPSFIFLSALCLYIFKQALRALFVSRIMKELCFLFFLVLGFVTPELVLAEDVLTLSELKGLWVKPQLEPSQISREILCSGGAIFVRFRGKKIDFSDGREGDECKILNFEKPRANIMVMNLDCTSGRRVVIAAKAKGGMLFRGTFRNLNHPMAADLFVKDAHYLERFYKETGDKCIMK